MAYVMRHLEINGGRVEDQDVRRLLLPSGVEGYADAQIDDYGGLRRRAYHWWPGTQLELRARFSHPLGEIAGTAGFGFWNAPFGDPSVRWPALPRATWFFYASEPSDLPLAKDGTGRGWFGSTIDASTASALLMAPLAPAALILNNILRIRKVLWPVIRRHLGISFYQLPVDLTAWHSYRLLWMAEGCEFWVDNERVLKTRCSPKGPLGFVCWLDNQYLIARPTGRVRWGVLPVSKDQWLEIEELHISSRVE